MFIILVKGTLTNWFT